ncbi:MAG TPA: flagellar biosynthetic protein FliO [Pantanalinema sp.]
MALGVLKAPGFKRFFAALLLVLGLWAGVDRGVAEARREVPQPPIVAATESAEGFDWKDYEDPGLKRDEGNPIANAVLFAFKFSLVIGMIFGAAWLYKRGVISKLALGTTGFTPSGTGMKVLESMPLKGGQSLHLVQAGGRYLVVGSNGRETLVKLTEWEAAPGTARFEALVDRVEDDASGDFSDALESSLRQVIRRPKEQP